MKNNQVKEFNKSKVNPISLYDEMSSSYLSYAMSVIISRALPDIRDGLKQSIEELYSQCIKEDLIGQNSLESQQE